MENTNAQFIIFKTEDEKNFGGCAYGRWNRLAHTRSNAMLFNKGRSTIAEHILNVFKKGELD